jgi:hypothetical protein
MRADCRLQVTLFAPEISGYPSLAWLREIGGISAIEGVDLTVIGGPDTRRNELAMGLRKRADVMIWSGHGTQGGLLIAGNQLLRAQWLATQVRCGIPRVMVIAACGSIARDTQMRSLAAEVAKNGINVVGFPLATEDLAAAIYNTELIRALVAGASVGVATDVALESIVDDHPETAQGIFLMPGLTNGYRDIVMRLEGVETGQHMLMERFDLVLDSLGITAPKREPIPC